MTRNVKLLDKLKLLTEVDIRLFFSVLNNKQLYDADRCSEKVDFRTTKDNLKYIEACRKLLETTRQGDVSRQKAINYLLEEGIESMRDTLEEYRIDLVKQKEKKEKEDSIFR
jgi:hypothetical protein